MHIKGSILLLKYIAKWLYISKQK